MYHDSVPPDGVRWAMNHLPYYNRWYRFLLLWPGADKGLEAARSDPDYVHPPDDPNYAVSEINAMARLMFTDWITTQVGDDQDLLAKVLPDYPATGKRTLQDNGTWLTTLRRDDVELVRTPIERITPHGVVTADGGRPRHRRHRLRHRFPCHRGAVPDADHRARRGGGIARLLGG